MRRHSDSELGDSFTRSFVRSVVGWLSGWLVVVPQDQESAGLTRSRQLYNKIENGNTETTNERNRVTAFNVSPRRRRAAANRSVVCFLTDWSLVGPSLSCLFARRVGWLGGAVKTSDFMPSSYSARQRRRCGIAVSTQQTSFFFHPFTQRKYSQGTEQPFIHSLIHQSKQTTSQPIVHLSIPPT